MLNWCHLTVADSLLCINLLSLRSCARPYKYGGWNWYHLVVQMQPSSGNNLHRYLHQYCCTNIAWLSALCCSLVAFQYLLDLVFVIKVVSAFLYSIFCKKISSHSVAWPINSTKHFKSFSVMILMLCTIFLEIKGLLYAIISNIGSLYGKLENR